MKYLWSRDGQPPFPNPLEYTITMDFIQGLDPSKLVFGGVASSSAF